MMRLIWSMTFALALAGLAACKPSDESVRNTVRAQALQGCRQGDPAARAQMSQMGLNLDELCTCAIDRYLASAPIEQLRGNPGPEAQQAVQRASMQCAQEMISRAGATPGAIPGAAPATNEAPTAPEIAPAAPAEPGAAEENAAE
jgi:hypothetical protein